MPQQSGNAHVFDGAGCFRGGFTQMFFIGKQSLHILIRQGSIWTHGCSPQRFWPQQALISRIRPVYWYNWNLWPSLWGAADWPRRLFVWMPMNIYRYSILMQISSRSWKKNKKNPKMFPCGSGKFASRHSEDITVRQEEWTRSDYIKCEPMNTLILTKASRCSGGKVFFTLWTICGAEAVGKELRSKRSSVRISVIMMAHVPNAGMGSVKRKHRKLL